MKVIVILLATGVVVTYASTRKGLLMDQLHRYGADEIKAWRYHDGSGWADGSDNAWDLIQVRPIAGTLLY